MAFLLRRMSSSSPNPKRIAQLSRKLHGLPLVRRQQASSKATQQHPLASAKTRRMPHRQFDPHRMILTARPPAPNPKRTLSRHSRKLHSSDDEEKAFEATLKFDATHTTFVDKDEISKSRSRAQKMESQYLQLGSVHDSPRGL